jgi:hypothetical protein
MALAWLAWDVNFRKNIGNALLWVFIGILFASFSEGIQYFLTACSEVCASAKASAARGQRRSIGRLM